MIVMLEESAVLAGSGAAAARSLREQDLDGSRPKSIGLPDRYFDSSHAAEIRATAGRALETG